MLLALVDAVAMMLAPYCASDVLPWLSPPAVGRFSGLDMKSAICCVIVLSDEPTKYWFDVASNWTAPRDISEGLD